MQIIYCLVPKTYWANYLGKETYVPRDYEQEGFIHATKGDDLLRKVANRVYADYTDELYLMVINEEKIHSEVKYEMAKDGNLYPHIYGELNQDAIIELRHMIRSNGSWEIGEAI